MNELDATLDSMGPDELRALETEIDKRAADTTAAYYLGLGAKLARESFQELQKSGTLTPALFLAKSAAEEVQKQAEVDEILDKCSAEELSAIEADLDAQIMEKASEDVATSYYEQGVKLARALWPSIQKEAAGGLIGSAVSGIGSMFARGGAVRSGLAAGMRFARKNPMATGAALGVGGTLVAKKVLD